jgi:hypothetical protein
MRRGRADQNAVVPRLRADGELVVSGDGVRYHGRGYRRTVVFFLGAVVVAYALLGRPWVGVSVGDAVLRLALFGVVVLGGGLWLALWPGLEWDEQGVTLIYALRRRHVRWVDLARLEWRRRGSMGKCLVLCTRSDQGIRVPTVMKVDGTDWWARLWESNLLRSRTGTGGEIDAMAALEAASRAVKEQGLGTGLAGSPSSM